MKRLTIALIVAALAALLAPAARTDTITLALVRVQVDSPEQANFLFENYDETHNHSAGEIELLLWPGDRAELDAAGFTYKVVAEDLYARDLALAEAASGERVTLPGPDRSDYRRLPDYVDEMKQLAKKNPGLVKLIEMPHESLEGRKVFGLEIAADVKAKDGRPIFYVDGIHHAREWPAGEYVMIYAHYLVERFGKDPEVTRLLKEGRVIAVPIVNVDGFDYSRESVLSANPTVAHNTWPTGYGNGFEGYWRKNRHSFTGTTVPGVQKNPDAYGVDPNRNYAYLWGDQSGGSSNDFHSQTYRGESPFSEPETKNVRDIILSRTIAGVVTNHTYQATVLRAGGGSAPDDDILEPLGARMAAAMGYENRGSVGYPTTGTTDDWTYSITGTLGFTVEHGSLGFHPPYASSVGADFKGVMKGFMIAFDAVVNERNHAVISGSLPSRGKVILKKTFATPLSKGNPLGKESVKESIEIALPTDAKGAFEFHVGPSSRPWEKKAEYYTLLYRSNSGKGSVRIYVDRGEHVQLGTLGR